MFKTICAALLVAATQLQPRSQHVSIIFPSWAVDSSCRVVVRGKAIAEHKGAFALDCASLETVLACDARDAEPIDVSAEAACSSRTIPLVKSTAHTLRTNSEDAVRVAWLQAEPSARPTVVAIRDFGGPAFSVNVAPLPNRYLRLVRPDASPLTIAEGEVRSWDNGTVPKPTPGGELVIVVPPSVIQPRRFSLRIADGLRTVESRSLVSVPGLTAGRYQVTPVYENRVFGVPFLVEVATSKTTSVVASRERVGGVHVIVDPMICSQVNEIVITGIEEPSINGDALGGEHTVFRSSSLENACDTTVRGLKPGRFIASARREGNRLGTASFDISAQTLSEVSVAGAGVRLHVRVERDGRPFNGLVLLTSRTGNSVPQRTRLVKGEAAIEVDKSGSYDVDFSDGAITFPGQRKHIVLSVGDNALSWNLSTAKISVEVIGLPSNDSTLLSVQKTDDSSQSFSIPIPGPLVELPGVALGSYRLSLLGKSAARPVTVTLDKDHTSATVRLVVESHPFSLTVRDQFGKPVTNAQVITRSVVKESQPGVFEFESVIPGDRIGITSPSLSPACQLVPASGDVVVNLRPGRSITMEMSPLDPGKPSEPAPTLLDVQGSNCGVQTSWIARAATVRTDDGGVRIQLTQFPDDPKLTLLTRSGTQTVTSGQSLIKIK